MTSDRTVGRNTTVNFGSPSMREERKKSNIRRPDDALRSVADKAASVLSAAGRRQRYVGDR